MNAAIRSVTRAALGSGFRVLGFQHGYEGVLREQFQEMNSRSVSNIVQRGGTILKTARSNFNAAKLLAKARAVKKCVGVFSPKSLGVHPLLASDIADYAQITVWEPGRRKNQ
jgi:6-phosphofructokinase 1